MKPTLGKCCVCEKEDETVRNIMMMHRRAPGPGGHGWGCCVCGLPPDGAIAVLCDDCLEQKFDPRFVCEGYAYQNKRVPIENCPKGDFDHDLCKHTEHEPVRRRR